MLFEFRSKIYYFRTVIDPHLDSFYLKGRVTSPPLKRGKLADFECLDDEPPIKPDDNWIEFGKHAEDAVTAALQLSPYILKEVARAKNWPKDFCRKGFPSLDRLGKRPVASIMSNNGLRCPIICGGYQCHRQET